MRASTKAELAKQTTRSLRELILGYKALMENAIREEGLTLPQLRLLRAVDDQVGEVSSATIARLCLITPQTLQTMLGRAVREGWIVRATSTRNHRILTASLTAKGKSLLRRGEKMAAQIEEKLWKGVSLATLHELHSVLEHGSSNLQTELSLSRDE